MILRRITEHVKAQNWFAVAIDFVIVVAGVFIGIQVANWNEALAENARSREVTERLIDDLKAERNRLLTQRRYYEEVRGAGEAALSALEAADEGADTALLVNAYRATQEPTENRRRATYDELKSSGDLGLIRDRALRETAASVFESQMYEVNAQVTNSPYRRLFRMSVPLAAQTAIAIACGDREDLLVLAYLVGARPVEGLLDYPCEPALDAPAARSAAGILRGAPQVAETLRLRIADLATAQGRLSLALRDLDRRIDGEVLK